MRSSLTGILGDEGYAAWRRWTAARPRCRCSRGRRFDLLLLDVWLPGMDGLETLVRASARSTPDLPVVVISGHGNIETAVKAVRMGAQDFVEKPLSLEKTLHRRSRTRCASGGWRRENRVLKEKVEHRFQMVGESPALRRPARGRGAGGALRTGA